MVWCWVNFQCQGDLLIWIIVGQGLTVLAVGAGGGCLDIFTLVYHFSFLSPSLRETARYRLKYCLKGPLRPKQPTNQPIDWTMEVTVYDMCFESKTGVSIFPSVHWVRLSFTFALALGLKTREPRRSPLAFSLSLEAM